MSSNPKSFAPMLASPADFSSVRWPMYASPKLDGVRAIVHEGRLVARSLKLIPNRAIREALSRPEFEGLDGELIVGDARAEDCYRNTVSGVMKQAGEPNWTFHIFDRHIPGLPWLKRWESIGDMPRIPNCRLVPHVLIAEAELDDYETRTTGDGYEGVMLRCPDSPYKYGRSTAKEGWLLKVKRFVDGEAVVLEVVEEMHNGNEATTNELGRIKRSSHQANKTGKGRMGALLVEDLITKVRFQVGTGFSDADKAWWWGMRDVVARTPLFVKYKSFPVGVKDKPRHPVYLGLRDAKDMS